MSFLTQWLVGGVAFMVVLVGMLSVLLIKQLRAQRKVAEGKVDSIASCACGSRESCDDDCEEQIYQISEPNE